MRAPGLFLALLVLAPTLAGCFGGQEDLIPDLPDIQLFVNASAWTADSENPTAEAFAVHNGTLVFVGTQQEAEVLYAGANVTDLGGRRVTPGLVDSHTHFVRIASSWNCDPANDPVDPMYDNSQFAGVEFEISRAQIAMGHYATNASGKTPVDDSGNVASRSAAARGLECAMKEANAMGLTMTIEAGMSSWDYFEVLQDMERQGRVTLRQSLYITPPLLGAAEQQGIRTGHGSDLVRIAGIKFYSDGWLGPRTAAVLTPYNDRPGSRGVLFLESPEAEAWVRRAHAADLKVATHSIGDQGVATMLAAYTKALAGDPNATNTRFSFEHASMIQPRFREGFRAINAIASYQHSFATSDQRFLESAVGRDRAAYTYAWKSLLDSGIVLAGGSDFPIEVLAPLWGLQRVVTRQELDGTPPGGYFPNERLSVEEALRTITINAAYNVFMEDRLGSLEAGKLADFVVFDQDILEIDPTDIAGVCVHRTYVGGRLVYDSSAAGATPCGRVAYQGQLAPRDPAVVAAIEERLEQEAWHGTRLG